MGVVLLVISCRSAFFRGVVIITSYVLFFFFFQAEDGIRDYKVTGVQTCALPISATCRRRRHCETRRPARSRHRSGADRSDAREPTRLAGRSRAEPAAPRNRHRPDRKSVV